MRVDRQKTVVKLRITLTKHERKLVATHIREITANNSLKWIIVDVSNLKHLTAQEFFSTMSLLM